MTFAPELSSPAAWLNDPARRLQQRFAIGVAVSLLLHASLIFLVQPSTSPLELSGLAGQTPLIVQLQRAPREESAEVVEASPPPPRAANQRPRVLAVPTLTPRAEPVPLQPPPEPEPVPAAPVRPPAPPMSFADMVNARRSQRPPTVSEHAEGRAEAETTASINRNISTLTRRGGGTGGVFQITNKSFRYAQFTFRGWRPDEDRKWRQTIDVEAGPSGDINLAIVQKMIELIRGHYNGDFNWESQRLGRVIVLSARREDNAGLEEFLLREFFGTRE